MKFFKSGFFWLLFLAFLILFAFPLKQGLKADPAVYATIARNVVKTGIFWPLHFSPNMFPNFYEHPPLVLWMMAFFMKVFGTTIWASALLSRLCSLAALFFIGWLARRWALSLGDSQEKAQGKAYLCLLLTLSWIPWIKYVGSAQYEGPLSLVLALALVLFFLTALERKYKDRLGWGLFIFFLFGFLSFMVKGIITFPIVVFLGLGFFWARDRKSYFVLSTASLLGWLMGAAFLLFLDRHFQSEWSLTYWNRILGWGFQGGANHFDVHGNFHWQSHFALALEFFKLEVKYSPLWTPFFWVAALAVLFRPSKFSRPRPEVLCVLLYVLFVLPFIVATIKMPHWPVPIYPVCALALVQFVPEKWAFFLSSKKAEQAYPAIVVLLAVFLAVIPYSVLSTQKRGEEWLFHQSLLENRSPHSVLNVIASNQPMYMVYAYSAWYLGVDRPLQVSSLEDQLKVNCVKGDYLWMDPEISKENATQLQTKNWLLCSHQSAGVRLWQCGSSANF